LVSIEELFSFDPSVGYAGILLLSFVFSVIPFIPVPYFPILIAAALSKNFDPHLIALSSAAAVVSAKTIIFFASYYGRAVLSEGTKRRMRPLQRVVSRYGWPGAFIAAATPIPDDIVYIPLGLAKYSPWKFATATFAGKLVMSEAIVWGSILIGRPFIESVLPDTTDTTGIIIGVVVSIAILGVTVYYSLRVDWARIIGKWFPWALEDENNNGDEGGKKDGSKP